MHYFLLFICIIVGIIVGVFLSNIFDEKDNQELSQYVPSIEEILCVLQVIRMTYRCSLHEAECVDEAIRLIESMEEKNNDGE